MKKKLLVLLAIMGASQAIIVNAGDECKAERRGIAITNDTKLTLYAGVYNADNRLCFDIIQINEGMQYGQDKLYKSLRN